MENNFEIIEYKNENKKILKYISESNNQFENRLKYIKILEKNNIDFKEACRISKIWYSIKYKKCMYPIEIYKYVMEYDKIIY